MLGHLVGGVAGIAFAPFVKFDRDAAAAAAVGLTIALQKVLGCVHPPAAAYSYLVAISGRSDLTRVLYPGLLGAACLMGAQKAYFRLTRALLERFAPSAIRVS